MHSLLHVLLVEDDLVQADMVRALLRDGQEPTFQITHATSIAEAKDQLCSGNAFDVVLLDLTLPDSQGLPSLTGLLGETKDVPIVVLTGLDDQTLAVEAARRGAQDYLVKHEIERGQLLRSMRYAIERAYADKALRVANQELEARVEARTKDLAAINKSLRAEIAQREEAQAKFYKAFHSNPSRMVITRRKDGLVVDANEAFLNEAGYSRDELVGQSTLDLDLWDNLADRDRLVEVISEQGFARNFEVASRTKSGEKRYNLVSAEQIMIGGEDHLIVTALDITKHKLAEEALRGSKEELEAEVQARTAQLAATNEVLQAEIANRSRIQEELLVRLRQQAVVAELGQSALTDTNLSALMDAAVIAVAQTLGVEYCEVLEILPGGGEMLLRAGVGWSEGYVGNARVSAGLDSQAGYALVSGAPVIVEDLEIESRFTGLLFFREHGVVSGLSVIIESQSRRFGVLGAHSKARRIFTLDDVNFVQAVGNVLAQAIERIEVESELRRARDELEAKVEERTAALSEANKQLWVELVERKRVTDALQESEARYRGIVEDQTELISRFLPDGTLTFVNDAVCRYFGVRREEFIGHNMMLLLPEPVRVALSGQLAALTPEDPIVVNEYHTTMPDGSKRWQQWTNRAIFNDQAKLVEYQGVGLDITERKLAERSLQSSEARFRSVTQTANDAIITTDSWGTIVMWNSAAQQIYGYSEEEILGKPVTLLMPESSRDRFQQGMERLRSEAHTQAFGNTVEAIGVRKDGVIFPAELSIARWETEEGTFYTSITRDITERKRSEEALRESEMRFRLVTRATNEAIWDYDLATSQVWWNDGVKSLFGYSDEQISAEYSWWEERIHPDDRDAVLSTFTAILTSRNQYWTGQYRFRRADGEYADVVDRGFIIQDAAGVPIRMIGSMMDVTDRKQTEAALRESDERFRAIYENAPVMIDAFAEDGFCLLWNAECVRVLGYTIEEINSVSDPFELFYPDPELRAEVVQAVISKDGKFREFPVRAKDGSIREQLWANFALPDRGVIAVGLDITERNLVEEELRASKSRLAGILDIADDAIISVDETQSIILFNQGAEKIFGYKEGEVLGRPLDILLPARATRVHSTHINKFTRSQRVARKMAERSEISGRRKDGTEFPAEASISKLELGGQKIFTVMLRDVTDRKHVEEVRRQKEAAEAANRAKSEFLSRMSHELRTPLNAILGFAQLLELDDLDSDQHESVSYIMKGGKHLLDLINEVLDISRIEAGTVLLSLEPLRVIEVLQESLDLVGPIAVQRDVEVSAAIDEACEQRVMADAQRLKQVLLNLLSNAVKYNRAGGSARVWCEEREGEWLRLSVSDTGLGIAPENMSRLFVPFERLGAERTDIEGTGLGLALSKRLVEAMGGSMGVESVVEEGTVFWIDLPVAQARAARRRRSRTDPLFLPEAQEGEYTVVYIEDSLSNLALVEHIVAHRPNIRLIPTMQGSMGLEMAREYQPDLVLLDLNLPDIPGEEVLRRLREDAQTQTIPVVMISADAATGQAERLLAAGAQAYLTKPLNVRQFVQVLEDTLKTGLTDRRMINDDSSLRSSKDDSSLRSSEAKLRKS